VKFIAAHLKQEDDFAEVSHLLITHDTRSQCKHFTASRRPLTL
jgi:hypothetical protein